MDCRWARNFEFSCRAHFFWPSWYDPTLLTNGFCILKKWVHPKIDQYVRPSDRLHDNLETTHPIAMKFFPQHYPIDMSSSSKMSRIHLSFSVLSDWNIIVLCNLRIFYEEKSWVKVKASFLQLPTHLHYKHGSLANGFSLCFAAFTCSLQKYIRNFSRLVITRCITRCQFN